MKLRHQSGTTSDLASKNANSELRERTQWTSKRLYIDFFVLAMCWRCLDIQTDCVSVCYLGPKKKKSFAMLGERLANASWYRGTVTVHSVYYTQSSNDGWRCLRWKIVHGRQNFNTSLKKCVPAICTDSGHHISIVLFIESALHPHSLNIHRVKSKAVANDSWSRRPLILANMRT